jgi:hypothetical protein
LIFKAIAPALQISTGHRSTLTDSVANARELAEPIVSGELGEAATLRSTEKRPTMSPTR